MKPISYAVVCAIAALALSTLSTVATAPIGTQAIRDLLLFAREDVNTTPRQDPAQAIKPCKTPKSSPGGSSPCSPDPPVSNTASKWTGPTLPCPHYWPKFAGLGPACELNPLTLDNPVPLPSPPLHDPS